eukprot:TRINITY_DN12020_c1_g1_i8.p1 TRINITY_DN12020_c1_g1~~TRINITY_DN12020_c1_g1_i8.p1  ORF type:complete len:1180 (+),score=177.83 TRINITY_DN12020_c1_g1_i8:115-3654(+)
MEASDARKCTKDALYDAIRDDNPDKVKAILSRAPQFANEAFKYIDFFWTPLQLAAARNNAAICEVLVNGGADINLTSENGTTALVRAVLAESVSATQWLLDNGAVVDQCIEPGFTALTAACCTANYDMVRLLLAAGANVNLPCQRDVRLLHTLKPCVEVRLLLHEIICFAEEPETPLTPLVVASSFGQAAAAELLLQAGVDPNDQANKYCVHEACRQGHFEVAKTLLANGADVHAVAEDEETALHIAAHRGDKKLLELLISHGANVDAKDCYDQTALHVASDNGQVDALKLLLDKGASVVAVDEDGNTALHNAGYWGQVDMLNFLLRKGADPNARCHYGESPLHYASQGGHVAAMTVLLDHGADMDVLNSDGETPLFNAVSNGDLAATKLLVARGATVDLQVLDGMTVLHEAAHYGFTAIIDLLIDNGADIEAADQCDDTAPRALHIAAQRNMLLAVMLLVSKGADINAADERGDTALHHACSHGKSSIAEFLLLAGAVLNCLNKRNLSPLQIAASENLIKVAQLLMAKGADPNYVCPIQGSALHIATVQGCRDMVQILLDAGANVNAVNTDTNSEHNVTPLYLACHFNDLAIAGMLEAKGADLNACSSLGRTPLFAACTNNHCAVVKWLLSKGAAPCLRDVSWSYRILGSLARHRCLDCATNLLEATSSLDDKQRLGSNALAEACVHGNQQMLVLLLAHNAVCLTKEGTLYMICDLCQNGSVEALAHLLDYGLDVNQIVYERPLLHSACEGGHLETVRLLVNRGANLNAISTELARMYFKETALHVACRKGHTDIVRYLLDHGAAISALRGDGQSPLICAVEADVIDCAQLMFQRGAHKCPDNNLDALQPEHLPLHEARSVAMAELALANGIDINQTTVDGRTPLMSACYYQRHQVVEYLLSKGAELKSTKKNAYSVLHWACEFGREETARQLLELGWDPNEPCHEKATGTPLHFATKRGHDDIVRTLIQHGCYVDARDEDGATALHYAVSSGRAQVMDILLEHGCNVDAADRARQTPLFKACRSAQPSAVARLLAAGADVKVRATSFGCDSSVIETLLLGWYSDDGDKEGRVLEILLAHDAEAMPLHYMPRIDQEVTNAHMEKYCRWMLSHNWGVEDVWRYEHGRGVNSISSSFIVATLEVCLPNVPQLCKSALPLVVKWDYQVRRKTVAEEASLDE